MTKQPYQQCFRRYEIKYLISRAQRAELEAAVLEHMVPDHYGESLIYNLYYDTPDYQLIRHSLERPVYKEKLRLRSYGRAGATDDVFLELKKKYDHVVYKRRIAMAQQEAVAALDKALPLPSSQIGREIDRVLDFYSALEPRAFLCYERSPYYARDEAGLRVTFDRNILWRETDLTLDSDADGEPLLLPGQSLVEIKTAGAIPLWLTALLTENKLYKTSFSKYGRAYENKFNTQKIMGCDLCSNKSFQDYLTAQQRPA